MIAARPLRAHVASFFDRSSSWALLPDLDPLVSRLRFELGALAALPSGRPGAAVRLARRVVVAPGEECLPLGAGEPAAGD
jgi:hypothetical protein